MGVNKKELEDKKEELTTKIHLLQVQSTELFQTKTFYETEMKNKIQRQNAIFDEIKQLERDIIKYDKFCIDFHNKWNDIEWQKNKLKEEKDKIKKQIWGQE